MLRTFLPLVGRFWWDTPDFFFGGAARRAGVVEKLANSTRGLTVAVEANSSGRWTDGNRSRESILNAQQRQQSAVRTVWKARLYHASWMTSVCSGRAPWTGCSGRLSASGLDDTWKMPSGR